MGFYGFLLSYFSLFIVAGINTACGPSFDEESNSSVSEARSFVPASLSSFERKLLDLINFHRTELGYTAFKAEAYFQKVTVAHSQDMQQGTVPFGHEGLDKRSEYLRRVLAVGEIAENVYYGFGDPKTILRTWLDNDFSRQNVLGDYNICGISHVEGYTTIIFGTLF